MAETTYDALVIGSGPGGYECAIRFAQLGMKTAIVERYTTLGGTCLNVGCIPSKALLDSSEHYYSASHTFKEHGINVKGLELDLPQMLKRKDAVVEVTVNGVAFLMKKNKIDVFAGHGTFTAPKQVKVALTAGSEANLTAKHIVIATGSKPTALPGVTIDWERIITSTEALNLTEVPKKLILIGGGVIGLELGSVYSRLGAEVVVLEFLDGIIPTMDKALGREMEKVLRKQGFSFNYKHKVQRAERTPDGKGVVVTALDKDGKEVRFEGDYCLVAVGRRPYTENLGLEAAGVKLDDRGRIAVDDQLRTSAEGIYAIGDVVRGAMLAHKASEEGIYVAEKCAGQHPHLNYLTVPNVVYTWPEVASVGYTEEELKEKNIPYKLGSFPFRASARARASMDLDGFAKVLAHKETDELLGVHIIGPRAADIIAEAVTAMEFRASAEDLGMFVHAHPTYSEAVKEAALAASANRAINI